MKGSLLVNISYMCQKEIMCQGKLLYANMRKVWDVSSFIRTTSPPFSRKPTVKYHKKLCVKPSHKKIYILGHLSD